jgi:hypothetical protein
MRMELHLETGLVKAPPDYSLRCCGFALRTLGGGAKSGQF